MALIWLGMTLGVLTTITMFGGTPADLVIFLFAVSGGCVIWGAVRVGSVAAIAWCLATAAGFLGLMGYLGSVPDDGTQGIGLLVMGVVLLGLACFVVAVMMSVRLWLRTARHQPRSGQPRSRLRPATEQGKYRPHMRGPESP